MDLYSFKHSMNGKDVPIGRLPCEAMALAFLEKQEGGRFTLEDNGKEVAYLMKKSPDGWGYPNIPVYRA